jgi:hypothetical protein
VGDSGGSQVIRRSADLRDPHYRRCCDRGVPDVSARGANSGTVRPVSSTNGSSETMEIQMTVSRATAFTAKWDEAQKWAAVVAETVAKMTVRIE